MMINFHPNSEQIAREIELCVRTESVDVVLGLCRCCIHNPLGRSSMAAECHTCGIQLGILKIANRRNRRITSDAEYLGVC